jgi:hypothetical protein
MGHLCTGSRGVAKACDVGKPPVRTPRFGTRAHGATRRRSRVAPRLLRRRGRHTYVLSPASQQQPSHELFAHRRKNLPLPLSFYRTARLRGAQKTSAEHHTKKAYLPQRSSHPTRVPSTPAHAHVPPTRRIARLPTHQLSSRFDSRATHARKLLTAASASV